MKALLFFAAALLAVSCASYTYNGKSYPTAEARDQAIAEAKRAQEQGAAANAQRDKAKAQAAAKLDALLAGIAPADLFDFRAWDVDKGHALLEAWTNTRDFPELGRRGQAIRDEFDYQARKAKLAALRKVRYALFAVHHDGNGREGFFGEYDFRRQCYPLVGYLPEQACPWTEPGTNPGHTCNPLSMSAEAVVKLVLCASASRRNWLGRARVALIFSMRSSVMRILQR